MSGPACTCGLARRNSCSAFVASLGRSDPPPDTGSEPTRSSSTSHNGGAPGARNGA